MTTPERKLFATHLRVGKGRTLRPGPQEVWDREYYEVEVTVIDDSQILAAKEWAESLIEGWLKEIPKKPVPRAGFEPARAQSVPQLNPEGLEGLPWSSYKQKDPQTGKAARIGPGQVGWIMRNTSGAEALEDLIMKQGPDVPVTMGDGHVFLVKFGGDNQQFIQRGKRGKK